MSSGAKHQPPDLQKHMAKLIHAHRDYADKNWMYFDHCALPGDLFELERHPAPSSLYVVLSVDRLLKRVITYSLNVKDYVSFEEDPLSRAEMFTKVSFVNRCVSYTNISYKLNVLFSFSKEKKEHE